MANQQKRQPFPYGRRYPWDRWFARGAFTLKQGRDFDVTVAGMFGTMRKIAARRGLTLSVRQGKDFLAVRVVGERGER